MTARNILCIALLSIFSLSLGVNTPAEPQGTQCLMQKQHHVSRSHPLAPNLHELLPEPVLALAWRLFEKEERIIELVENSVLLNITYSGVKMSLRMNQEDDATHRLGEEGMYGMDYDLDTLDELRNVSKDMLNMLDVGGNLGVVSIAAYKKYAKHLRIITIEPSPQTFFFLNWNLHINGVPEIDMSSVEKQKTTLINGVHSASPGVLALNRGITDAVDGEDLHFCDDPRSSMNNKVCDCKQGEEHCLVVPSVSVDSLASMFGTEPIALVKMDCEGCEFKILPALVKSKVSKRVMRLAGELHLPDSNIEELACRWEKGRLMSKCQRSEEENPEFEIECGVELKCNK